MRHIFFFISFLFGIPALAQQNQEFRDTKTYFDSQEEFIKKEFENQYSQLTNDLDRAMMKTEFLEFYQKFLDARNNAYVNALVAVKNREDLSCIIPVKDSAKIENNRLKSSIPISRDAEYPDGIDVFRKFLVDNVNFSADTTQPIKATVTFIVETNGEISNAKAKSDYPELNKKIEIALYLLPKKFNPATIENRFVRTKFRMPLSLKD